MTPLAGLMLGLFLPVGARPCPALPDGVVAGGTEPEGVAVAERCLVMLVPLMPSLADILHH